MSKRRESATFIPSRYGYVQCNCSVTVGIDELSNLNNEQIEAFLNGIVKVLAIETRTQTTKP